MIGFAAFSWRPAAAEPIPPDAAAKLITKLGNEALAVLRANDTPLASREAKVRNLLRRSFDLKTIGRFVLGQSWRQATADQKAAYQEAFEQFVLYTYARRLGGYSGESFRIVNQQPAGQSDALVTTEIQRPSGPPLTASWRIRRGPEGDKIIDVIVEGASMAVAQRSEFNSVVQRQGIDGLIETLRLKVNKYSVQSS